MRGRHKLTREQVEKAFGRMAPSTRAKYLVTGGRKINALGDKEDFDPPCRADPDSWYPEDYADQQAVAIVKRVCANCPLREGCLAAALQFEAGYRADHHSGKRSGIWGGLDPYEREALEVAMREDGSWELL